MTSEITSRRHLIKEAMTQAVLAELPTDRRQPLEEAMVTWWMNIRQQGGFRLSDYGDTAFQLAQIEHNNFVYEIPASATKRDGRWMQIMLDIDQALNVPYYFYRGDKKQIMIRVYDSKTAMLVNLYGTFQEFIDSVKSRKKR